MKPAKAIRALLVLVLVIAAWRTINWMNDYEPGPDSSIFMSMGWHAMHNYALYKDVWDHKPPMISLLDGAAIAAGGNGATSVHTMERIFAVLGVGAFFLTVLLAFGRFWIAWIASAVYLVHFYQPYVIELGNVTEEYGAVFFVCGMAAAIASLRPQSRRDLRLAAISGFAFCLAFLSKEPFALMIPPWLLYVAWPRNGDWSTARKRGGAFMAGALAPLLIFVIYLLVNSALYDWIDAVAFNFLNKAAAGVIAPSDAPFVVRIIQMARAKMHPMSLAVLGMLVAIGALFSRSFVQKYRGLPIAIASSALLALLATSLGGGFSGHYYLFFVPLFVLLFASGVAFVADLVSHHRMWTAGAIAILVIVAASDYPGIAEFVRFNSMPTRQWKGLGVSRAVATYARPGDLVWAPWSPLIYVETKTFSPTKYHFAFEHLFIDTPRSTAAEKFASMRTALVRHPPRVIVLNTPPGTGRLRSAVDDFLLKAGLTSWLAVNYQTVTGSPNDPFQILTLKSVSSTQDPSASRL
jgi:4-amino-4-deoxy-L-arabinose transferase-like glycosyltransferase